MEAGRHEISDLVAGLDRAVAEPTVERRAEAVKRLLADLIGRGDLRLDERYFAPKAESYARRLLHRDAERGYSVVVMTWGPGQGTVLHDHAGIWCVEGTAAGEMEVLRFDIVEEGADGRCRFAERGSVRALPGASGALIPPFEYHILRNGLSDRVSLTLHVYGGEMDHCHVFLPEPDGWYRRVEKRLSYDV
jgi:3-mercaptopropionate dioxygenase